MLSTITGDEAKRARDALGASQTAVAAAIGVNRTYYSLFESGRYVLDEQEQQQLREFLSDSLPAHGGQPATDADQDGDDGRVPENGTLQPSHRQAGAAAPKEPAAEPSCRTTDALTALATLRNTAAEPNGLRTKRTAAAVGNAIAALEVLDYAELLDLANEHAVPTAALPDLKEFNTIDLARMELWESRAAALLVCDAMYAGQWSTLSFDELKVAESNLNDALGEDVVKYEAVSIFSLLWGGQEHHASRRRAELAPFIAQAAQRRSAPQIARPSPFSVSRAS